MEEKLKQGYIFTVSKNDNDDYIGALQFIKDKEMLDFIELTDKDLESLYYLNHIKQNLGFYCYLIVKYNQDNKSFNSSLKLLKKDHYEEEYITESKTFKGALLKLNYNKELTNEKRGKRYVKR